MPLLALTRKEGDKIRIGDNIKVTVVRISGNRVRISIEAPQEVKIIRDELPEQREKT